MTAPVKVSGTEEVQRKWTWWRTVTADHKELGLEGEKITEECEKWRTDNMMALFSSQDD